VILGDHLLGVGEEVGPLTTLGLPGEEGGKAGIPSLVWPVGIAVVETHSTTAMRRPTHKHKSGSL
jgi:hypothetical protein